MANELALTDGGNTLYLDDLYDLRDLIKEAEGQVPARYVGLDDIPLYTALGEKP